MPHRAAELLSCCPASKAPEPWLSSTSWCRKLFDTCNKSTKIVTGYALRFLPFHHLNSFLVTSRSWMCLWPFLFKKTNVKYNGNTQLHTFILSCLRSHVHDCKKHRPIVSLMTSHDVMTTSPTHYAHFHLEK
jgi:hypothetical protein